MAATNEEVVIQLLIYLFGIGLVLGSYVGMRHMRAPPRTLTAAFVLVDIIIPGTVYVAEVYMTRLVQSYVCEWLVIAKVYTLLLIAMERYYDVIDPVACQQAYLGGHKLLAVAVTWIGSAVLALFSPSFQASTGSRMDSRLMDLHHLALLMIMPAGTLVFSYYHMRRHVRWRPMSAVEMLHRGHIHDVDTLARWSVRLDDKISHKLRLLILSATLAEVLLFLPIYLSGQCDPRKKIALIQHVHGEYGCIELLSAPIIFALMTAHIARLKSDVRNQVASNDREERCRDLTGAWYISASDFTLGDEAVHSSAPPTYAESQDREYGHARTLYEER